MSLTSRAFQLSALAAQSAPKAVVDAFAANGARLAARRSDERRFLIGRHMRRALGADATPAAIRKATDGAFEAYARYYRDTFILPALSAAEVDAGFSVEGFENIENSVAAGKGTMLILPHLGGWEWAGYWLATTPGYEVSAVVEPLDDTDVMDWFAEVRESINMHIITLGPDAGTEVTRRLKNNEVVCLLADRHVGGASVEVEFFGERTEVPAGPATLALRTGAQLIPVGVYHRGDYSHAVCRPPVTAVREGRLRADVTKVSQAVTRELEFLIGLAPEQWHLAQPNWPSDHEALASWRASS